MTLDVLTSLLHYDQFTGKFYWKAGRRAGKEAGFGRNRGRIQICIQGKNFYAHRLAWKFVYGVMPTGVIDHMNGDPLDNRICNLRETDQSGNLGNQRRAARHNKSSGLLGVSKKNNRWRAAIKVNKKTIHIGTFDTKEQAFAAYVAKKREVHRLSTI